MKHYEYKIRETIEKIEFQLKKFTGLKSSLIRKVKIKYFE